MAVGATTGAYVNYSSNAPTVAVPAGAVAGDLYILAILYQSGTTITWPSGFTEVAASAVGGASGPIFRVAVKTAIGSESGNFVAAMGGWQKWSAICGVVTGFLAPEEDSSGAANNSGQMSSVALNGIEITTIGAGRQIIWFGATIGWGFVAGAATVTPPSGLSIDRADDTGTGLTMTMASGVKSSAGAATYSGTADFGAVTGSRSGLAITIALTPTSSPPAGAVLEANIQASATVTADLTTSAPFTSLAANAQASATVTADLTTGIALAANITARATVRAKLDGTGSTSIFLQSTAVQPLATGPWIPSPWFSSST